MNSPCILIIDDEGQIRKLLTITLESYGYQVMATSTAKEGTTAVAGHQPDLVLLDIGLPDESGHEVLKHLREWYKKPVIVLSVQNTEEDIVKALDAGANDYLVKPFRTGELMARIRSALRNTAEVNNDSIVEFGDLVIDFNARIVRQDGRLVKCTLTEYSLLVLFAKNEGKVLTHQYLLNQVWGPSYREQSQYLRVFVAQLRKKIEKDPNRPAHIITEPGVGYRFVA